MKVFLAAVFGAGIILSASDALADGACNPLKLVTQVDITSNDDNTRIYVPVTMNGQSKLMLIDTGSAATTISEEAAIALGISIRHGNYGMYDLAGKNAGGVANSGSFSLGSVHADAIHLVVAPPGMLSGFDSSVIGLIGMDILSRYDVEIDMAAKKFTLLSQDHCEGKVIYWPASTAAAVPMMIGDREEVGISVSVNGHALTAAIDTGAPDNLMDVKVAQQSFGVVPGSSDAPEAGTFATNSKTYSHQFKTLGFEGIVVSKPSFILLPNLMKTTGIDPSIDTRIANSKFVSPNGLAAATIGMATLRHLHMYFAFKEKKLYLTP